MFQIRFIKCKYSRFVHFNKQHAKDTVHITKSNKKVAMGLYKWLKL